MTKTYPVVVTIHPACPQQNKRIGDRSIGRRRRRKRSSGSRRSSGRRRSSGAGSTGNAEPRFA